MRSAVRWAICGCLALSTVAAWAHEKPGEPNPDPAMQRLAFMVGKFQSRQKVELPGGPGIERTVTQEGAWMNGGHQIRLISPNEGFGGVEMVLSYDPISQEYHGWAFTNLRGMPGYWSGTLQAGRLVLNGHRLASKVDATQRGAPQVEARMIYQAQADGGFVVSGERQQNGRWEKSGESIYTPLSR